jgi:Glutamyl- and glutaminyl-tRNA synthetases
MEYAEMGYIPDAMNNYLARLGWSFGDQEIFTKEEAAKHFGFSGINKAAARLDFDKLNHVNQQHILLMSPEDFVSCYQNYLANHGLPVLDDEQSRRLLFSHQAIAERVGKISDITEQASYMFVKDVDVGGAELQGLVNKDSFPAIMELSDHLGSMSPFDEANIMAAAKEIIARHNLKLGKVGPTLRVLLTGQKTSPSIFQVMACLGAEVTAHRLKVGLAKLSSVA